ncbi:MAG: aminotransferase class I/II-fold pyridoxal phosphate-dependent enzyme, partial [Anaerolineales bacterium]|nr:aminotransferase class I/II-fold pyridoxal phosphate-dependent enzyme [Anaerolineales bacterium]
DMEQMQVKRDRLVEGLREAGYEVHAPEGTFYLLPKAPLADDIAFADQLAAEGVLVLPGTICEMPGYLRLSLTANETMIERALPIFKSARASA